MNPVRRVHQFPSRVAAAALILALMPMPWGYYTLLRIVVCSAALYNVVDAYGRGVSSYIWAWLVVVVLFNPLLPVGLGRGVWAAVDLLSCGMFLLWNTGRSTGGSTAGIQTGTAGTTISDERDEK